MVIYRHCHKIEHNTVLLFYLLGTENKITWRTMTTQTRKPSAAWIEVGSSVRCFLTCHCSVVWDLFCFFLFLLSRGGWNGRSQKQNHTHQVHTNHPHPHPANTQRQTNTKAHLVREDEAHAHPHEDGREDVQDSVDVLQLNAGGILHAAVWFWVRGMVVVSIVGMYMHSLLPAYKS